MTPVAFPGAFKAFLHFTPAYFPGFKYFKADHFHSRLFDHVIQPSFSPNAKFQKPRSYLCFLGNAMLFHILEAFLKFASELPWTPSFPSLSCPHGHSLSSYFYLFNGCLTWHFYIRLSLVCQQNFPSRKIAPAPPGTLPWDLSSKGCLRCFFPSLFH